MSSRRILIIDNEESIREVAQICLETVAAWEVATAASGREGIQQAEIYQPDVILLDVMMPDMDGVATFQELQRNTLTHHIPVILLTAKLQQSDRTRYTDLGIQAVIGKPFDPLDLANQIAAALDWA